MAIVPYFAISPSAILSLFGLIRGAKKVPEHARSDWRDLKVDVIIPAYNEERGIGLCLASLFRQTIQPRAVILIDDHSSDRTIEFAKAFCEVNDTPIRIISRHDTRGKTEGVRREADELDCDVEFILDADTVLDSDNYIERVVEELYRVPGIATACGSIHPLRNIDRERFAEDPSIMRLKERIPDLPYFTPRKGWHAISQEIANLYRDVLYYFMQNVIYRGDQAMFGSIPNPVGCAVAYRREYLKETIRDVVLEHGDNLTTSEDIFFGLSFIYHGYRNVQVRDVIVRSEEPEAQIIPKQLLLWSSAWLQSAYYLPRLILSPALTLQRSLMRREHTSPDESRRQFDDPYRWPWGQEHSDKAGRAFGWVVSLALLEKLSFPIILLIMIIFQWWGALIVTVLAESLMFSLLIVILGPEKRLSYLLKGLASAPLRYGSILFDVVVLSRFVYDITVGGRTEWRK